MKKKMFSAVIAFVFIAMFSCNNDEKQESINNDKPKSSTSELMEQLRVLNTETLAQYNTATESTVLLTRGIVEHQADPTIAVELYRIRLLRRIIEMVKWDTAGAYIGGRLGASIGGVNGALIGAIIVGVGASISSYSCVYAVSIDNNTNSINSEDEIGYYTIVMDSICYNMNNEITSYDQSGDCHNKIILEIINDKNAYINKSGTLNCEEMLNKIESSVQGMGYDVTTINMDSVRTVIDEIYVASNDTTVSTTEAAIKLCPEHREEIQILNEYVETAAALPNVAAVKMYSKTFEKTISQSNISGASKAALLSGESVGKNSVVGWNVVQR